MPDSIKSGVGNGYEALVDAENRVHTVAVSVEEQLQANVDGDAYNINTGDITLTSANESAVLYIKNNEDRDFRIRSLIFGVESSTGGSSTDVVKVYIEKNPTGGTIVSNATAVDMESNSNFGSSSTILIDAYKGAEGYTTTGGTDHAVINIKAFARTTIPIDIIVKKGQSIGVLITPPSSNTSMALYVAATGYLRNTTN